MRKKTTKTFKIPKIILAPLSGISSLPFRKINREAGCKFAFLEMISARSLSYSSKRTLEMMQSNHHDRPLGLQLLGKDPCYILKALDNIKEHQYDVLDFNAACPQKRITAHGKGAALLKEPKKLQKLLKLIKKQINIPLTVKLRLGWDSDVNALNVAKRAQDAGINAVFIHGRTKTQGYHGPVNYPTLRKIKAALKIPVIASGDIWSSELAKKMFDETGCDAITVARGALGNPWIFKEIDEFLNTGKTLARPNAQEICRTMKQHLNLNINFCGERIGTMKFRKFYIWYTRGLPQTKPLRANVAGIETKNQMLSLIEKFLGSQRP